MTEVLRIMVVSSDPSAPVKVREFEGSDRRSAMESCVTAQVEAIRDHAACVTQWVGPWFDATWGAVTLGDEVLGGDGRAWVVARPLGTRHHPHEVVVTALGAPADRFAFTPAYDQPVRARRTDVGRVVALLGSELGARVLDVTDEDDRGNGR